MASMRSDLPVGEVILVEILFIFCWVDIINIAKQ